MYSLYTVIYEWWCLWYVVFFFRSLGFLVDNFLLMICLFSFQSVFVLSILFIYLFILKFSDVHKKFWNGDCSIFQRWSYNTYDAYCDWWPAGVFQEDRTNSVTIGVADEHIGLVVGRGGRNITEISQVLNNRFLNYYVILIMVWRGAHYFVQVSGARIKISDRGDFMSGTNDR